MPSYVERPIKARNPWLVRPDPGRGTKIAGLMLHATRSGKRDGDDGPRTEGWDANPLNRVEDDPPWGSFQDVLIFEDGTRVLCTDPDREYAAWTAGYGGAGTWAAGIHYIQVELAQGTTDEPFSEAQVDSLAQFTARMAGRYAFPIVRIPFLAQTGTPPRGICDHEHSANGRVYGKSDPGALLPWEAYLRLARRYADGEENDGADPDLSDYDRLLLAVFAGGEERAGGALKPAAERLAAARWRLEEVVAGRAPSVRELALRARPD